MNFINKSMVLAALSLVVGAGCGGDGDKDSASPDAQEADTTAPTIVSTSPEDGASGVRGDVAVVITFSEAMDQASVEGTLDASDLGDFALSWNDAGDTLTITPDDPLPYAEGIDDLNEIEANAFTVVLGNAAKDVAGNAFGEGESFTFTTLRQVATVLKPSTAWSRSLSPSELMFEDDEDFAVGDTDADIGVRAVVTFDLSQIPLDADSIVSAVFATRQVVDDVVGSPFTDLSSSVLLDHVTYGELLDENAINAAYNASQSPLSTVGDFFVEDQVIIELDVSDEVSDDFAHREERGYRSQYLARFDSITDQDGAFDGSKFSRDLLELQVTYLHP